MRRAGSLCLLALLLAAPAARARETAPAPPDVPAGPATIHGRVVHLEDAERSVAGVPVILYALLPSGIPGVRQGVSDDLGRFRFEGVGNGTPYLVGADYQGVPYSAGARVAFAPGELEREVEIRVAEATRDAQGVAVSLARLRIDWLGVELRIAESLTVRNGSSRTVYVPAEDRGAGI